MLLGMIAQVAVPVPGVWAYDYAVPGHEEVVAADESESFCLLKSQQREIRLIKVCDAQRWFFG